MSRARNITKIVIRNAAMFGIGTIVHETVKAHVQPTTAMEQITVATGSIVIAGIVQDASAQYVNKTVDEIFDLAKSLRNDK